MILRRILARFRPPVPTPDGLAALSHLLVFGLAVHLLGLGDPLRAAVTPAAVVAETVR